SVSEGIVSIATSMVDNRGRQHNISKTLVENLNEVRNNLTTNSVSNMKSNTNLEDLILGELNVGSLISYLDPNNEESKLSEILNKGKKAIAEQAKEAIFGKSDKNARSKTILDVPILSDLYINTYDKIKYGDSSNMERATASAITKVRDVFTFGAKRDDDRFKEDRASKTNKCITSLFEGIRKNILGTPLFRGLDKEGSISTANTVDRGSKVAFDAETHNSINTVIPGYLAKMLSVVSNTEEIHYDYETGLWNKVSDIHNDYTNTITDTIFNTDLVKSISEAIGGMGSNINYDSLNADLSKIEDPEKLARAERDKSLSSKTLEIARFFMDNRIRNEESLNSKTDEFTELFGQ